MDKICQICPFWNTCAEMDRCPWVYDAELGYLYLIDYEDWYEYRY